MVKYLQLLPIFIQLGLARITSYAKIKRITKIKHDTNISIFLKPILLRNKRDSTSKIVIRVAKISGILNNKFKAIAAPITSVTSVTIIASSAIIHRITLKNLSVCSLIAWAKSNYVTIPNLTDKFCRSIAIKLDNKIVEISKNWKL